MAPLCTSQFAVEEKIAENFLLSFTGASNSKQQEDQAVKGSCDETPSPPSHHSIAIKVIETLSIERQQGVRKAVLLVQRLLRRLGLERQSSPAMEHLAPRLWYHSWPASTTASPSISMLLQGDAPCRWIDTLCRVVTAQPI
jgi:hypothetical protein